MRDYLTAQKYMTIAGVSMTCIILLLNLGSRAWWQMKKKHIHYNGPGGIIISCGAALLCGLAVPYLGYRQANAGGRVAIESMLVSSLLVAVIFMISDIDAVQKFIIVGSEQCDQDTVNICVGIWWSISLLLSMYFSRRIEKHHGTFKEVEEHVVIEDHESPVGYKVKALPDFCLDQHLNAKPYCCGNGNFEIILGVIMAIGVGTVIAGLSFTDLDDKFTSSFKAMLESNYLMD